jgi:hypothetical protein
MTTTPTKTELAIMVQPEQAYGSRYLRAYVMLPQENGELYNPSWWRFSDRAAGRFAGFRINAYVGHSFTNADNNPGEVWGISHEYVDVRIEDADHAAEIAKVLRMIEKGLDKIRDEEGYSDDLHLTIMRIARILKIRTVYVRNFPRAAAVSGQTYRKINGSDLQSYVAHVSERAGAGKWHEVISR